MSQLLKKGGRHLDGEVQIPGGDDCGGCAAIIENYSRREPSEITTS